MDRRDTLKTLLVGTVAGAMATGASLQGCKSDIGEEISSSTEGLYGRTPDEIKRDQHLSKEIFLNEHELSTIALLCDIILPATNSAGAATEAGVVEFIDFIVKDLPQHQIPLRGGLMWLDQEAIRRFHTVFSSCTEGEQISLIDEIAYEEKAPAELRYGVKFFKLLRDLTLTGYYTSRMGFEDLGYKGNIPTIWDGVPQDVLDKHGLEYDPEWVTKCVDQDKRNEIASWDDEGNLLT